jgi:hypothetical protein
VCGAKCTACKVAKAASTYSIPFFSMQHGVQRRTSYCYHDVVWHYRCAFFRHCSARGRSVRGLHRCRAHVHDGLHRVRHSPDVLISHLRTVATQQAQ